MCCSMGNIVKNSSYCCGMEIVVTNILFLLDGMFLVNLILIPQLLNMKFDIKPQ